MRTRLWAFVVKKLKYHRLKPGGVCAYSVVGIRSQENQNWLSHHRRFNDHCMLARASRGITRGPLKCANSPHLNLKFARWIEPSFNCTTSCRQVPAHDGSVFQT